MKEERWVQRFSSFCKAYDKLRVAIDVVEQNIESENKEVDEVLKEGLIQRFEYTQELAWKVMKDYALYQGNNEVKGSRDAIREAFKLNLITNADVWLDMISSRNLTFHTYDAASANKTVELIISDYAPAFKELIETMNLKII